MAEAYDVALALHCPPRPSALACNLFVRNKIANNQLFQFFMWLNKFILLSILLASSTSTWSQWVKFGENDIAEYYIDPSSVRQEGKLRRVWEARNFNVRSAEGVMSRLAWWEIDCQNARLRILSFTTHPRTMGRGDAFISDNKPTPWSNFSPGTVSDTLVKLVCAN